MTEYPTADGGTAGTPGVGTGREPTWPRIEGLAVAGAARVLFATTGRPDRRPQPPTSLCRRAGSPAALLAWVALASAVAAFGVLQFSPTGLDPIRHAVSEWGLGPYAWGYRWFTVSLAVAGAALSVAVPSVLRRRAGPAQVLLVLFALARSVVGWVPMDAPGAAATTTGLCHWALGIITFVSFIVLAFMLGARSVLPESGRSVGRWLTGLGLVGVVCVLEMSAATRVPALMEMFGLFERLDYLAMTMGLAALAALASGTRRVTPPSDT